LRKNERRKEAVPTELDSLELSEGASPALADAAAAMIIAASVGRRP
jgi:hypothetical protein